MNYYKDDKGNLYCLKDERDGLISITEKEFNSLKPKEVVLTKAQKDEMAIQMEITKLKLKLSSTDYKAIKFAEGLISEADYAPIKAERQAIREQIKALEAKL